MSGTKQGLTSSLHSSYFEISCKVEVLRAILQESEAKLEMKNFNPPSILMWR